MKSRIASNALKVLLLMFGLGSIFVGVYVLPTIAKEMLGVYPQIADVRLPILIISESLLIFLIVGIAIIMYLLKLFDKSETFTLKFTKGLETLFWMSIIAATIIVILYQYMRSFGGPGVLLALIMIGITFIILIVAAVIMLVRAIVKESITYKNEYDLTV